MILLASSKYNLLVYSMEPVWAVHITEMPELLLITLITSVYFFDEKLYSIYDISMLISKSSKRDHLSVCLSGLTFCVEITLILKVLQNMYGEYEAPSFFG